MQLVATTTYRLELTQDEMILVGLALAGKLRKDRHWQAAQDLNIRILRERKVLLSEQIYHVEKTLEGLNSLEETSVIS